MTSITPTIPDTVHHDRHPRGAAAGWLRAVFCLDPRSLAIFRMMTGGILVADAVLRTRDFHLMFAPDGMFPPDVLRGYEADPTVWSACFLNDAEWWQACVLGAEGLAGAALALGFHTRVAIVVAWIAAVSVLRRTMPATNSGDIWLTQLLFWGMFLPLGGVWSLDARSSRTTTPSGCPLAVPLVLQVAAVYVAAGLSKIGGGWLTGDAISNALSVHDHGTPLGDWVASLGWTSAPFTWGVLALELLGPFVFLAVPRPAVRAAVVLAFLGFHAAIAALMTVGLFAPIGIAAWSALVPSAVWDRFVAPSRFVHGTSDTRSCHTPASAQALFGAVAVVAWLHAIGPWAERPLPKPVSAIVNIACLRQDWGMFGDVPPQKQWVYGRAALADGRLVDPLRGGRPLEQDLPTGGYFSLPHHRWHKIFWELPKPRMRVFAAPVASAIAREWNATHPQPERIVSLELRAARRPAFSPEATLHELLLASWPERDEQGGGNLDRFLHSEGR